MRVSHQHLVTIAGASGPLYVQIYQRFRELIVSGAWPEGTKLPSSRRISLDLGVSRNTALLAIDKLIADGWIVARAGSGMYVSRETLPTRSLAPIPQPPPDRGRSTCPVPFAIEHGAIDLFPVKTWKRIHNGVWTSSPDDALHEGPDAGWLPLRREIATYLYAFRGLACSAEQVVVVSSTQAAIDLTLRVLGQAGDGIWVEDPGYPQARSAFQSHGLVQHGLPVDDEGIDVEAGRASAPNARFAYVTAACQFPCCIRLSEQRRQSLLGWALERKSYILEDDWDFNATFTGQPPVPPLAARDAQQVIFIHSLSRLLFPALRIAALVVPNHLVDRFLHARRAIDGFPNVPNQMALAEFMNHGFMSAHLRRCRIAYEKRRLCLHRLLEEQLGDWFKAETGRDGLQAIVRTGHLNSAAIASAAQREGIVCRSLSEFAIQQKTTPANLILGFGAFAPESLEMATGRLRDLMRKLSSSVGDF